MSNIEIITVISAIVTPILVAFIPVFVRKILADIEREKLTYEIAQKKTVDLITEAFPHLLIVEEKLGHLAYSHMPICEEDAAADPEVTRQALMKVRLALLQLSVFPDKNRRDFFQKMANSMLHMQNTIETRHNYPEPEMVNEILREHYHGDFQKDLERLFELLWRMIHHA